MFEGVLYFALGFLAAALIALMISPAIWNRAVVLTKRRIESSVPLTLNEVQADKDQLRAEFAMSTRRLELSIEQLQEKAARQVIEINRKRDELAKLAEEGRTKIRTVEDLDARGADLRARLAQREEQLEKTGQELDRTRQQLDKRGHELEEMQSKLTRIQNESDSHRIELVAKQTSLDDVSDQVSAAEARRKSLEGEVTELRATVKRLEADLASAKARGRDAEERAERTRTLNSQLEENLEAGERNVSRLRAAGLSEDESSNELTRLLMEERKRTDKLEADLARATLRMETILTDASNENVSKAMTVLNKEKSELRGKLKTITAERDALKQSVDDLAMRSGAEWEDERKENAVLRERMNDLAARVTAMTAAMEGPDSPISDILEKAAKDPSGDGNTLADRIRALQDAARVKQAT